MLSYKVDVVAKIRIFIFQVSVYSEKKYFQIFQPTTYFQSHKSPHELQQSHEPNHVPLDQQQ